METSNKKAGYGKAIATIMELQIVTRDQLLALSPFASGAPQYESKKEHIIAGGLHAADSQFSAARPPMPSPTRSTKEPPGLEGMGSAPRAPARLRAASQRFADPDLQPIENDEFKVLLRNMPESMTCQGIWSKLKEAQLSDGVKDIATRPGGKVLITFDEYEYVVPCITHFMGGEWKESEIPVIALYVNTTKKPHSISGTDSFPCSPVLLPTVPVFVPGSAETSPQMLPTAAVFVPGAMDLLELPPTKMEEPMETGGLGSTWKVPHGGGIKFNGFLSAEAVEFVMTAQVDEAIERQLSPLAVEFKPSFACADGEKSPRPRRISNASTEGPESPDIRLRMRTHTDFGSLRL